MRRLSLAVTIAVMFSFCLTTQASAFTNILIKFGIDATKSLVETGYEKLTASASTKTVTTVTNEPQWQQAIRSRLASKEGVKIASFDDKVLFPGRTLYVISTDNVNKKTFLYTLDAGGSGDYLWYSANDTHEVTEMMAKSEKEKLQALSDTFRQYTPTHVNLLPSTAEEIKTEAARDFKAKNGSELVFLGTNETVQINSSYSAQAFYGVGGGETLIVVATQDSSGKLTGHYVVVNQLTFAQMGEDKVLMAKTFNEQTNLKLEVEPQAKELAKLE